MRLVVDLVYLTVVFVCRAFGDNLRRFLPRVLESIILRRLSLSFPRSRNTFVGRFLLRVLEDIAGTLFPSRVG